MAAFKMKPGTVLQVKTDRPERTHDVRPGARGVLSAQEGEMCYAHWVNLDGSTYNVGIHAGDLEVYIRASGATQERDLRNIMAGLFDAVHEMYGRPRSNMNAAKVLELWRAWKGSPQILLEMIAWLDQSPDVQEAIGKLGYTWNLKESVEA